jgi:enoyl-[acyl-carrier-protein] reductase (NADH)
MADKSARARPGRKTDIDNVGAATAFRASTAARRITGTVLSVNAGLTIS